MKKDIKKIGNNLASIKKSNIPKEPTLALNQLQIWAHLETAEDEFSKIFLVSELQWLIWAFGDISGNKRKKELVPLILNHLKKDIYDISSAINKDFCNFSEIIFLAKVIGVTNCNA
ncbi:hypothetical protein Glove_122g133 [Diversispora epigaea]|uniref:Uncharacterized protein n=1 Tax=Diversispora epigaea TaxID=1348612 RepID=A0A397J2Z1_9GLOM|nr:hypothetical protein Glove_122g133 [Diversispora epigaea]